MPPFSGIPVCLPRSRAGTPCDWFAIAASRRSRIVRLARPPWNRQLDADEADELGAPPRVPLENGDRSSGGRCAVQQAQQLFAVGSRRRHSLAALRKLDDALHELLVPGDVAVEGQAAPDGE